MDIVGDRRHRALPACMQKDLFFLKENSLLKFNTTVHGAAIPAEQTVTYQERSQNNMTGLEAQTDLAAVLYWF